VARQGRAYRLLIATKGYCAMSTLLLTHLNHDLTNNTSYVHVVWSDDPNRRLGMVVPFGTTLADAEREAVAAVRALSAELAAAEIVAPSPEI